MSQIALKRFISEEVCTWSTLRSPRVVELFGVVREGLYVFLFMDLKSGEHVSSVLWTHSTLFFFFSSHWLGWENFGEIWRIKRSVKYLPSWCKTGIKTTTEVIRNVILCDSARPEMTVECPWSLVQITDVYMINTLLCRKMTGHSRRDTWIQLCVLVNINKTFCILCPGMTPSVVSGSLGQLIAERGRLPEDLSLHYHLQVLTALEYLVKKRVAHLDIKGTTKPGIFCQFI